MLHCQGLNPWYLVSLANVQLREPQSNYCHKFVGLGHFLFIKWTWELRPRYTWRQKSAPSSQNCKKIAGFEPNLAPIFYSVAYKDRNCSFFLPGCWGETDWDSRGLEAVSSEAHSSSFGLQSVDADQHGDRVVRRDQGHQDPRVLRDVDRGVVVDPGVLDNHVDLGVADVGD